MTEPLDIDTAPELEIIRNIGRLQIDDCTPEEVRLARLLYEPWGSEVLESAYPTERSIALKQARIALAFASNRIYKEIMSARRAPEYSSIDTEFDVGLRHAAYISSQFAKEQND